MVPSTGCQTRRCGYNTQVNSRIDDNLDRVNFVLLTQKMVEHGGLKGLDRRYTLRESPVNRDNWLR